MALLGSRLRVPVARRELVARPRLLSRLDADPLPPVVLVSAPAGSGKTTFLLQWLRALSGARVAWLSLDETDADARELVAHLAAALQEIDPAGGAHAADLLSAQSDATSERLAVELLRDLEAMTGPLVLVLDDCHVVDTPAARDVVRTLAENLPAHITLVISTRQDPPLPLPRWRARGELVEVRADDLRFSIDEAEAFLNRAMGSDLARESVAAIVERTEGWAVGLQLAALAARGRSTGEVSSFVDELAGSRRFVLDYLLDEVLHGVTAEIRGFLLDTAALGDLTAALCDAVTGRDDATAMLDEVERSGLFLTAVDDARTVFRYHRLFADALAAQALAVDAGRVAAVRARAARRLAAEGRVREAVPHALASGETELAAELVAFALPGLRRRRQDAALARLLEQLPAGAVRARPLLLTYLAWTHLVVGDLAAMDERLDAASAALAAPAPQGAPHVPDDLVRARAAEERDVPAMIEVFRATACQACGDAPGTRAHAELALTLTAPDQHSARGAAAGYVGIAAWADGDLDRAIDTFGEAIRSLRAAGSIADALAGTVVLAEMWEDRGRSDEAERVVRAALRSAEGADAVAARTIVADLHVALASLLVARGLHDEAEERLAVAAALGDAASLPENRYRRHVVVSAVLQARGDLEGAAAALDVAEALRLPGFLPELRPIAARRAQLRAARTPGEPGLSPRELDVLRLLDTALSGPEIARRLYVTVNTLRTHTKHIFTKLDVTTRRAAVERARELGLI